MNTVNFLISYLPPELAQLVLNALPTWINGGWAMIPLAMTGAIMYTMSLGSLFKLLMLGARRSPDAAWRAWQKNPNGFTLNPVRTLIAEAMQCSTLHEMETYFGLLESEGLRPFTRQLTIIKVCVTASPLLGLLGTVTGMLTTFGGLAKGGGGDQTMDIISKGISEALITTETGLVVALTGVFILFILTRQHQRYEYSIAHIETLCMSALQKRLNHE